MYSVDLKTLFKTVKIGLSLMYIDVYFNANNF